MPLVCSCRDVIEMWLLLKGGLSMLQDSGAKHPEWGKECLHVLPRAERMEGRHFPGRARRGVQPCGWKAQGAQGRESFFLALRCYQRACRPWECAWDTAPAAIPLAVSSVKVMLCAAACGLLLQSVS